MHTILNDTIALIATQIDETKSGKPHLSQCLLFLIQKKVQVLFKLRRYTKISVVKKRRKERKVNRKIKREEERKRNKYEEINMNDQRSYTFNLQCDYSYQGHVTKFSTNLTTKYRGG